MGVALDIHRLTDANTGGGVLTTILQSTVFANGLLVSVDGSLGTGHGDPPHCNHCWVTTNGGPHVFAEGIPVNKRTDPDSCRHPRAAGSPNVFVGYDSGLPSLEINTEQPGVIVVYDQEDLRQFNYDEPSTAHSQPAPSIPLPPSYPSPTNPPTPIEQSDETLPQPPAPVQTDCGSIPNPCPDDFQLSTNFTLGDLSTKALAGSHRVQAQCSLTEAQIICNLMKIAQNILEPLVKIYGKKNIMITSGFRPATSCTSQHEKGQAVDIQFADINGRSEMKKLYYERAQKITQSINFDQLILEYNNPGRNNWLHISYNDSGNRRKINTKPPGLNTYPTGLILY